MEVERERTRKEMRGEEVREKKKWKETDGGREVESADIN